MDEHGAVQRRRLIPLFAFAAIVALGAILKHHGTGALAGDGAGQSQTAVVQRVVDGDTIVVELGGTRVRVRYIGIDTPESVKQGTPVQGYAETASKLNDSLVWNRKVLLVYDQERTDRYGRTLAYVYREPDGLFVNAELVRRGAARTLEIAPDTRHAGEFARLAAQARERRIGLWSAC